MPLPEISVEAPLWAQTLSLLCQLSPWRELPDSVTFRFDSAAPELAAAVAIVLGRSGERRGVVLYRSEAAYERFLAAARARRLDLSSVDALCLYIEPADGRSTAEQESLGEAGLLLPGGQAPRLLAMRSGAAGAASAHEQRILLAATEAIVRLSLTHLPRLRHEPQQVSLSSCVGPISVRSQPGILAPRATPLES